MCHWKIKQNTKTKNSTGERKKMNNFFCRSFFRSRWSVQIQKGARPLWRSFQSGEIFRINLAICEPHQHTPPPTRMLLIKFTKTNANVRWTYDESSCFESTLENTTPRLASVPTMLRGGMRVSFINVPTPPPLRRDANIHTYIPEYSYTFTTCTLIYMHVPEMYPTQFHWHKTIRPYTEIYMNPSPQAMMKTDLLHLCICTQCNFSYFTLFFIFSFL